MNHAPQTKEAVLGFGEPEYYVRPLGRSGYEVTVFHGGPVPAGVYTVRGVTCTCPAGGGSTAHKHVELVRLYQRLGEPNCFVFWRDEDSLWHARRWTGDEHVIDNPGHRLRAAHLRHTNRRR